MKQVGLPHGLANVLQAQWSNQKRILQWRQSCYKHPLRTPMAIPQGDPMSPLALNILMWAGQRYVETQSPCTPGDPLHVVYMDDRAGTSTTPRLLLHTLDTWRQFSAAVGLKENIAKTQLTYSTPAARQALEQQLVNRPDLQSSITTSACVLGSCTTGTARQLHPKEQQRLEEAGKLCAKIRFLPTDYQPKLHAARSLAVSKASYGWVAFTPSLAELDRFTATVRSTSRASKHLRQMLFGGIRSLDVVIGVKQVALWGKRFLAEQWSPAQNASSILVSWDGVIEGAAGGGTLPLTSPRVCSSFRIPRLSTNLPTG